MSTVAIVAPTDPQLAMIERLCAEQGWQPPEAVHSKAEASEIISAMLASTYDPDLTATYGNRYGGMAYAMAWRIGELNDEDLRGRSPEERFAQVLAWVRKAQLPSVSGEVER